MVYIYHYCIFLFGIVYVFFWGSDASVFLTHCFVRQESRPKVFFPPQEKAKPDLPKMMAGWFVPPATDAAAIPIWLLFMIDDLPGEGVRRVDRSDNPPSLGPAGTPSWSATSWGRGWVGQWVLFCLCCFQRLHTTHDQHRPQLLGGKSRTRVGMGGATPPLPSRRWQRAPNGVSAWHGALQDA